MWIELENGWRDETSEGPGCHTNQTYYDWKTHSVWSVVRYYGSAKFVVKRDGISLREFDCLQDSKDFVKERVE